MDIFKLIIDLFLNVHKKVRCLIWLIRMSLIDILRLNAYQSPPPYEKLVGDLEGAYSRRINIQHRLVYQILEDIKTIKIISMWSHYEF